MEQSKVGFTLTELLVVVLVIGILAAVVLPKFTKTLENYKTAEAEHMLEAVRNEQEARCELGDGYTADTSQLGTWATDTSKYFNYALHECGMSATRIGEGYVLQIPWYEDGRICCEGCDSLNKDYPSCADLGVSSSGCSCAAEAPTTPSEPTIPPEEPPTPSQQECSNAHQEGVFPKSGVCACGKAEYRYHCGSDTNYEWTEELVTACEPKPETIKAATSDAIGTPVCENDKWRYKWEGGHSFSDGYDLCNAIGNAYYCSTIPPGRNPISGSEYEACKKEHIDNISWCFASDEGRRCFDRYSTEEYACAGANITGTESRCVAKIEHGCEGVIVSGKDAACTSGVAEGCAYASFTGDGSHCNGEVENGCYGSTFYDNSLCIAKVPHGCDGVLYGTNPNSSDNSGSSLDNMGACLDNDRNCPDGVPVTYTVWSGDSGTIVSEWKGGCCNPSYMVGGACPSDVSVCGN